MSDHRSSQHLKRAKGRWVLWAFGGLLIIGSVYLIVLGLSKASAAETHEELRTALETHAPFDAREAGAVQLAALPAEEYPPNTLAAPGANLSVPLQSTGLNSNGDLAIPSSEHAGLFTGSAPLSADSGSSLIAGHVTDRLGSFAPMAQLALLEAGDSVVTVDAYGVRKDWTVVASKVIPRIGLGSDIWEAAGERKLVLVTCAGRTQAADRGVDFTGNLVVTAVPR